MPNLEIKIIHEPVLVVGRGHKFKVGDFVKVKAEGEEPIRGTITDIWEDRIYFGAHPVYYDKIKSIEDYKNRSFADDDLDVDLIKQILK